MTYGGSTIAPVQRPLKNERMRASAVRKLHPGYFALVMATGIVSSALRDAGHPTLSAVLLILAAASFVVLLAALSLRVIFFRRELLVDLSAADRTFSFFTFVAACSVLGNRLVVDGHRTIAVLLGAAALLVWVGLSYGIPLRLILGPRTEPVLAGVNGTWFIWVVGTQSIAVITAALGSAYPEYGRAAALGSVLMWSAGFVLYGIVATLVLTRLLLLEVRPQDLTPPYWVTMGATAITVLAAARILGLPDEPAVHATRPVVSGLAVILWAFGTWLIPMLVAFGIWRHMLQRIRLEYLPQVWSIIFPLGMYATSSMEIGRAINLPIIESIGRAWVWVAFPAWALTFTAMLWSLTRAALARRSVSGPGRERSG